MTEQEFEAMFADSLSRLDAYIATQETEGQISSAKHHRRQVEMNKSHWKWCADHGKPIHACKHCGAITSAQFMEPIGSRMRANGTCFHCDHWQQLATTPDKTRLIINGHIYGDGGNQPNSQRKDRLGFGGHVWTIERDGRTWQTNNLWSGSDIPAEHRAALPDNARFVKSEA